MGSPDLDALFGCGLASEERFPIFLTLSFGYVSEAGDVGFEDCFP